MAYYKKRTDVHRRGAINPTDYEYVACEMIAPIDGFAAPDFIIDARRRIAEHMKKTGGTYSQHEHGGNCHVCGSPNAIYTSIFYHQPTNSYIRTGTNCTDNLDRGEAERFRRQYQQWQRAVAGKRKAQHFLKDNDVPDSVWQLFKSEVQGREPFEKRTIRDIISKLVRYGHLSDKQVAFVKSLAAKLMEPQMPKVPVPTGKVVIQGTIRKLQDVRIPATSYRTVLVWKCVVVNDAGWAVYGTLPKHDDRLRIGDKIQFTATVEASAANISMGFYKRPSKAKVMKIE